MVTVIVGKNIRQRIAEHYLHARPNEVNLIAMLEFLLSFYKLTEVGKMIQFGYRPHLARSNIESLSIAVDDFSGLPETHWIKREYSPTEVDYAYNSLRHFFNRNRKFFEAKEREAERMEPTLDLLLQSA